MDSLNNVGLEGQESGICFCLALIIGEDRYRDYRGSHGNKNFVSFYRRVIFCKSQLFHWIMLCLVAKYTNGWHSWWYIGYAFIVFLYMFCSMLLVMQDFYQSCVLFCDLCTRIILIKQWNYLHPFNTFSNSQTKEHFFFTVIFWPPSGH